LIFFYIKLDEDMLYQNHRPQRDLQVRAENVFI